MPEQEALRRRPNEGLRLVGRDEHHEFENSVCPRNCPGAGGAGVRTTATALPGTSASVPTAAGLAAAAAVSAGAAAIPAGTAAVPAGTAAVSAGTPAIPAGAPVSAGPAVPAGAPAVPAGPAVSAGTTAGLSTTAAAVSTVPVTVRLHGAHLHPLDHSCAGGDQIPPMAGADRRRLHDHAGKRREDAAE